MKDIRIGDRVRILPNDMGAREGAVGTLEDVQGFLYVVRLPSRAGVTVTQGVRRRHLEPAPLHVENCETCEGTGEIHLWPMHFLTSAEIAAGLHHQTAKCPECEGTERTYRNAEETQ